MSDEIDNMLNTLEHHAPDWIIRIRLHISQTEAANAKLRAVIEHITEYWNRDQNEKAMADALWHIIETADEALAAAGIGDGHE